MVANAGRAKLFLVNAALEDGRSRCFVVEAGRAGLTVGLASDTVGLRGLGAADVVLVGVRLGTTAILREGAETLLEAVSSVGDRRHCGRASPRPPSRPRSATRSSAPPSAQPICQHQAIQLKLADMATPHHRRAAAHPRAASASTWTRATTGRARWPGSRRRRPPYAVSLESMRIHGGYGYTSEFPVERYYRDAAALLPAARPGGAERRRLAARWLAAQIP